MSIGLADWFYFTHTDGRRTILRQTKTRLMLIIERPNERHEWRLYADPHGMILDIAASADTLEQAFREVER